MKRRLNNRLYYFTVEDESLLAEAFPRIDDETYAITYKVNGTDDVFITNAETRDAMDRNDVPHSTLAEEDGTRIGIWHSALSREELGDYEESIKALVLAYRGIAAVCVGFNGGPDIDLTDGIERYSYFTAPAGHTFIWRLFDTRRAAIAYMRKRFGDDPEAIEWARTLPLKTSKELVNYH